MSLKHALLTMLEIEERSGYELMKLFDQSIGFFWPSSFQQVYRDLETLEEKSFISAEKVEQTGKPDKKIYSITTAGVEELRHWQGRPSKPMKIKDPLLIKVIGGHRMDKDQLLSDISRQQQHHQSKLDNYLDLLSVFDAMDADEYEKNRMPYQTLKLGIKFESAWLEWANELTDEVEK